MILVRDEKELIDALNEKTGIVVGYNTKTLPDLNSELLTYLWMSYNEMKQIPSIRNHPIFDYLSINDNNLEQIPEQFLMVKSMYFGNNDYPRWLNYKKLCSK